MTDDTTHMFMLTTIDNPFNPFSQYDEWDAWDRSHGYCSNALAARVYRGSNDLSEADQAQAEQDAIDEVVRENVSGMHIKVSEKNSLVK